MCDACMQVALALASRIPHLTLFCLSCPVAFASCLAPFVQRQQQQQQHTWAAVSHACAGAPLSLIQSARYGCQLSLPAMSMVLGWMGSPKRVFEPERVGFETRRSRGSLVSWAGPWKRSVNETTDETATATVVLGALEMRARHPYPYSVLGQTMRRRTAQIGLLRARYICSGSRCVW